MKKNYNTLLPYILDNSLSYSNNQETVRGLFRAVLEPLFENQKFESQVFIKLHNTNDKDSLLKRLQFTNAQVFSFSEEKQFGETEFIIILAPRYSVALMWDYSLSENPNLTPVCLLYNSKTITDIVKKIKGDIEIKYLPDRRENSLLNKSIKLIADALNNKNEELMFSEMEKENILKNDDRLETAAIVAEKAKFIAHEIKNNLSIINLYSTIAQKRTDMPEILTALNNIQNASESISNHIGDLRCLSAPYKTENSITQMIFSTVMQCSEKAKKQGVEIIVKEFDDAVINTDKTKFQCALLNIIFNAIEASTKGCKIGIDCILDSKAKVFVKNNGAMIPEEIQQKIFEPDFTTKEKGNGLGLAICKKQLELLGGNIMLVRSSSDETVFVVELPL